MMMDKNYQSKSNCQKQDGSETQKFQDNKILDGVSELLRQRGQKKLEEETKRKYLGRCCCDCSNCSDCVTK